MAAGNVRDLWDRFVGYVFDSPWQPGDNPIGNALAYVAGGAVLLAALPFLLIWRALQRLLAFRQVTSSEGGGAPADVKLARSLAARSDTAEAEGILQGVSLLAGAAAAIAFPITWLVYGAVTGSLHWHTTGGRGGPVVRTEHPNLPEWTLFVFWFGGTLLFALTAGYLAIAVNRLSASQKPFVRIAGGVAIAALAIAFPIVTVLYIYGTI